MPDHATLEVLRTQAAAPAGAGEHQAVVAAALGMAGGMMFGCVAKHQEGGSRCADRL